MAFSEETKRIVRQKAAFQCCRCRSLGVEIHHIVPQKNGGLDDLDNAAPLCPNCHSDFGDNSEKRKSILEMRNWWYETVDRMYSPVTNSLLKELGDKVENIQKGNTDAMESLKIELKSIISGVIDNMNTQSVGVTASNVMQLSLASSSKLGDGVHANMMCKKCGTRIGLLIGSNNCPNCEEEIS
jgi:Zn finger protein HypA/HybF involved in hydrogenase expression